MQEYELRPVEVVAAGMETMSALLQTAFPKAGHFTTEVLHWQYAGNPDGTVVGFNAWQGEQLAGHYVTIPMRAVVNGREEKGLLSLNTATHPAHQGKGLFTKLAKATYARAADEGFAFVAGVANANSTHGFIKKLEFDLVSPLRAMIGAGPLPRPKPDAEVQFAHLWDAASVAWRLRHPAYAYSVHQGKDRAVVLSARKQFGARYILGIREPGLVDAGTPRTRSLPCRKVWIGLDPALAWGGRAFVNIPMRFRPAPLNLIFRDLTGKGRKLDPARVRWDAMDFDIL